MSRSVRVKGGEVELNWRLESCGRKRIDGRGSIELEV